MKKIFYLLFAFLLITPFLVKAEGEGNNYRYDFECEDYLFIGPNTTKTCSLNYANTVDNFKIKIRSGDLLIGTEGSEFTSEREFTSATVMGNLDYGDPVTVILKNENNVTAHQQVNLTIEAFVGNDMVSTGDYEFHVYPEGTVLSQIGGTSDPVNNNNNNNTGNAKAAVKSTSKGITNPNTSDENVLMLSIVSILLVFIIGLSLKKFVLIKR